MAILLLDSIPDDFDVESDDEGYVVTIPACQSDCGGIFTTLDCRLSEMSGQAPDCYEFSFGFTVSDLDGGAVAYFTQDRFEVERYFDGNTRDYVIPTVCEALCALVDAVQPAYIFRVTKGRNLPQRALAKHFLVTETLLGLGYHEVDTGTDHFDRLFWLMAQ